MHSEAPSQQSPLPPSALSYFDRTWQSSKLSSFRYSTTIAMVAAQHQTTVFCLWNFTSRDFLSNVAAAAGNAGAMLVASTRTSESRRLSVNTILLARPVWVEAADKVGNAIVASVSGRGRRDLRRI